MKVTIDGIAIDVPEGTTILQAARRIGPIVAPPAMCYYSKLKTSGGYCRTCLVEVTKSSEKDPRPMPKLVASCRTTVADGMEVTNQLSQRVLDARAGVVGAPSSEAVVANSNPLTTSVLSAAAPARISQGGRMPSPAGGRLRNAMKVRGKKTSTAAMSSARSTRGER